MKSVVGERPQLPRRLLDAAEAHARDLGRTVVSDDLFLLALTWLDEAQPARRALASEDIAAERLMANIPTAGDGPLDPPTGLLYSPAYYSMHGRAEGFAAALGDGRITPEHVLLALLWDPRSNSSHLLWRLGVNRERLVERLGELSVPVPVAPLPLQREIEWGERVWFDRRDVGRVLDHLRLHIPPATTWGFNYEGERACAPSQASTSRLWSKQHCPSRKRGLRPLREGKAPAPVRNAGAWHNRAWGRPLEPVEP